MVEEEWTAGDVGIKKDNGKSERQKGAESREMDKNSLVWEDELWCVEGEEWTDELRHGLPN